MSGLAYLSAGDLDTALDDAEIVGHGEEIFARFQDDERAGEAG